MKAYFQAIFYVEKEYTEWVNVIIVDILAAYTFGEGYEDAIYMAKDCLKCMLGSKNVLNHFTPYETTNKMCKENEWIELIEIDLPEQTIQDEKIFLVNIDNYFPSQDIKMQNDKKREFYLKNCKRIKYENNNKQ